MTSKMRMAYFAGLCVLDLVWILHIAWHGSTRSLGILALPVVTTLGAALVLAGVRAGRIMFLLAGTIQCILFAFVSLAAFAATGLLAVGGNAGTGSALLSLLLTILLTSYVFLGLLFYAREN